MGQVGVDGAIEASKSGDGLRLAAGLMAIHVMATLLVDRGQAGGETIDDEHQKRASDDATILRAKADALGRMTAEKFLHEPGETRQMLAETVSAAMLAMVLLRLVSKGCGVPSVAMEGIVGLGCNAAVKDLAE